MAKGIAQLYHKYVGRKGLLTVLSYPPKREERAGTLGIQIAVWVLDARIAYGNEQVLVRPPMGVGSAWVNVKGQLNLVDQWPDEDTIEQAISAPPVAPQQGEPTESDT